MTKLINVQFTCSQCQKDPDKACRLEVERHHADLQAMPDRCPFTGDACAWVMDDWSHVATPSVTSLGGGE